MPEIDIKPRSRAVTDGVEATTSRGMLRAVGMGDGDWEKPQIGIASSWNEITPCNLSLDRLARSSKEGVHAGGGYPLQFGTISVSDGISMGHEGMHFSLVSREVIADSVETVVMAERLDGTVLLAGCDKSLPGMLMAAARLDLASVFVYAGSIAPGFAKLEDGTIYEVDIIIMAVGFDAGSGALARIDITGRDCMKLAEEWGKDIRTTMGLMKYGFPNLFMTGAPLAPSAALCNMTTCLQQQTEWITTCIRHMRETGNNAIEPTLEGEDAWVRHHDETANANLIAKTNSWYTGSNVPGKPRRVLSYTGGVGTYRDKCDQMAKQGYPSFRMSKAGAPQAG
jgi:hypothetical protein